MFTKHAAKNLPGTLIEEIKGHKNILDYTQQFCPFGFQLFLRLPFTVKSCKLRIIIIHCT